MLAEKFTLMMAILEKQICRILAWVIKLDSFVGFLADVGKNWYICGGNMDFPCR